MAALSPNLDVGSSPVSTSLHWRGTPLLYVATWAENVTFSLLVFFPFYEFGHLDDTVFSFN